MKIAVLGSNGQLGSDLVARCQEQGWDVVSLTHQDLRVEEIDSVRRALRVANPGAVLNTTAFHHVPVCEKDAARAFAVNAQGALHVARVAEELGAINVYYSTDYVFDGALRRPYREEDLPNPLNVYATSKLAGESLTLHHCQRAFVFRVSGIYGRVPCRAKGDHFVRKMIQLARDKPELRVVTDEILTPTPTWDIARHTLAILRSEVYGLYHLTCEGSCSWYEFTREIFDVLGIQTPLLEARAEDFPGGVRRPQYSVLENHRLHTLGGEPMPDWRQGLHRYLENNPPS